MRPLHPRPPVFLLLRPVSVRQTHPRSPGAGTALSPSFSNVLTWGWLPVGTVVLPRQGGPLPPAEAHAVGGEGVLPGPWGLRTPTLPAAVASGHALLFTHY